MIEKPSWNSSLEIVLDLFSMPLSKRYISIREVLHNLTCIAQSLAEEDGRREETYNVWYLKNNDSNKKLRKPE